MMERMDGIYDVISLTHDTRSELEKNKDTLLPYEPVIAVDTNEIMFKDEQGNLVTLNGNITNTVVELQTSKQYKNGDVVQVLGYYTKGDGAHHYRKASTTDDGSGVLMANGLYANIVHNGEVQASWFGAGFGKGNDADCIQKAVDLLKITRGLVVIDSPLVVLEKGLVFYGNVSVHGINTAVDCNKLSDSTIAVRIIGSNNSNIGASEVQYAGVKSPALRDLAFFKDKNVRGTSIGLATADDTNTPSYVGYIENCQFLGFRIALSFRSRAYLLRFHKCGITASNCVEAYGGGDSGENITFTDCTFFNSSLIFNLTKNNYYAFFLRGCSIDYSGKLIDMYNGFVSIDNCWIEGIGPDSNTQGTPDPSNLRSQGTLKIINSDFRGRGSNSPTKWSQPFYFKLENNVSVNFIFKDNYVHNNSFRYLINKSPRTTYDISGNKSHQNSGTMEYCSDENFSSFDMWRDSYITFTKDSHSGSDGTSTKMTVTKIPNVITGAKNDNCYKILTPVGASEFGLRLSHEFKGKSSMRIKYKIVNRKSTESNVWPTLRNNAGYFEEGVVGIKCPPNQTKEGEYIIFRRDGQNEQYERECNMYWDGWLNFNMFDHYGDVEFYISDIICESW